MRETKKFKAADGKTILVEVNSQKGNRAAVLMVHGFTGGVMSHTFQCAAKTFPTWGIDTWRVYLYSAAEGCRPMNDTTWDENVSDIKLVQDEMQKAYPEAFLAGHSLGGAQIVYAANEKTKALALWEPACTVFLTCCTDTDIHPDYYEVNWGITILASKIYVDGCRRMGRYVQPIPHKRPTLVVLADQNTETWPEEIVPAKVMRIANCDHGFNNEGNLGALFRETIHFFGRTPEKKQLSKIGVVQ